MFRNVANAEKKLLVDREHGSIQTFISSQRSNTSTLSFSLMFDAQDTDQFCRNILCSPELIDLVQQQFVCWGGDVRCSDAYAVSGIGVCIQESFHAPSFAALCAFICNEIFHVQCRHNLTARRAMFFSEVFCVLKTFPTHSIIEQGVPHVELCAACALCSYPPAWGPRPSHSQPCCPLALTTRWVRRGER